MRGLSQDTQMPPPNLPPPPCRCRCQRRRDGGLPLSSQRRHGAGICVCWLCRLILSLPPAFVCLAHTYTTTDLRDSRIDL